jgi:hypothetical protein
MLRKLPRLVPRIGRVQGGNRWEEKHPEQGLPPRRKDLTREIDGLGALSKHKGLFGNDWRTCQNHWVGTFVLASVTMARRKQPRTEQGFASASEKFKTLALREAQLVPWPKLMQFVDKSLRWEPFLLWIRAVVNAAEEIPPVVEEELERRVPGLSARFGAQPGSERKNEPLGEALWNYVSNWVLANVLLEPKIEGWPNALIFFASRTMTYMKVWAHWERMNQLWKTSKPAEWPSYECWQRDAAAVTSLPNQGEPQYILDAVNSVPPSEWERMLTQYRSLIIFGVWLELMLDLEGTQSHVVARAFAAGYPGFAFTSGDLPSRDALHELLTWGLGSVVRPPSEEVVSALTWHVEMNPEYHAIREYAIPYGPNTQQDPIA